VSQTPVEPDPVAGGYCAETDLRVGDTRLPDYMGTKEQRIQSGAQEIDAALGHIYVTPLDFTDPDTRQVEPESRPARLMVRKINWLITSGRMLLDMDASGEEDRQHAYGLAMLKEGLGLLQQIVTGEMILAGALVFGSEEAAAEDFTGPKLFNEDPESLVEGFYQNRAPGTLVNVPVAPYGIPGVSVIRG
jgi:hypothetical protein